MRELSGETHGDISSYQSGAGVAAYSTGNTYISNNTITDAVRGIAYQALSGYKCDVTGNIIANLRNGEFTGNNAYAIMLKGDNTTVANSEVENNLFYSPTRLHVDGTTYTDLATLISSGKCDDNGGSCLDVEPSFSENGYSLTLDSPAIDAGNLSSSYSVFQTLYGKNITTDILGNARPSSGAGWDIGAYEYVDEATAPPPSACVQQAPFISAMSSNATSVQPGDSVIFNYQVTNNDGIGCPETSFDMSSVIPNGWAAQFNQSQISLAAGSSTSVALSLTVGSSAIDGSYNVVTNTQRNGVSSQVSASNTITVLSSLPPEPTNTNSAPIAVNDSVMISSKTSVDISVLSNDSDPDGNAISVISVTQGAKGSVALDADGTVIYSPNQRFKSKDSFTYMISDGELTSTATVTIQLEGVTSGKGNGGGKGRYK